MRVSIWIFCLLAACGGDEHPDTGYGGNTPVPASVTCAAACARIANCAVKLCDEDTSSSKYDALESSLEDQCELTCDDTTVGAKFTASAWSCLFMETCRGVFEHDVCDVDATYTCRE